MITFFLRRFYMNESHLFPNVATFPSKQRKIKSKLMRIYQNHNLFNFSRWKIISFKKVKLLSTFFVNYWQTWINSVMEQRCRRQHFFIKILNKTYTLAKISYNINNTWQAILDILENIFSSHPSSNIGELQSITVLSSVRVTFIDLCDRTYTGCENKHKNKNIYIHMQKLTNRLRYYLLN